MRNAEILTVTAAEFHRNVGVYQDMALTRPVAITKNGRERTVLLSADEFHWLKRRDRQMLGLGDFTAENVAAIAAAKVDPAHNHLNAEIVDWQP